MKIVIDSSIAVKWIVGEDDSALALELRRHYLPHAPELLSAECANAVLNKVRRGHLTREEAYAAAELLSQLSIEFHPLQSLIQASVEYGLRLGHPAYDCMFLALAEKLVCPLVTADNALIEKAKPIAFRVTVLTMRQAIDRAFAS